MVLGSPSEPLSQLEVLVRVDVANDAGHSFIPSIQDVKLEQSPGDPQQSGHEPDEEGDPKGLPIERREVRPGDLMRLSPVLGDVRESLRHDFLLTR